MTASKATRPNHSHPRRLNALLAVILFTAVASFSASSASSAFASSTRGVGTWSNHQIHYVLGHLHAPGVGGPAHGEGSVDTPSPCANPSDRRVALYGHDREPTATISTSV